MDWSTYTSSIKFALDSFTFDERILRILLKSRKTDQRIYVAGNGGSAAIAMHYSNDLNKGANPFWDDNSVKRFNSSCLSTDVGYITCISNDAGYERIFKDQLINLAKKDDILILISSSGNSPNVIEAAKWGKQNGLIVIGITGFTGGKLKNLVEYSAHINFNSYEVCEDIHAIFGHFLAVYLRDSVKTEVLNSRKTS